MNVGVSEDGSISALRDATLALVAEQRKAIQAGAANAEDVAKAPLVINGESEVVN